MKIFSQALLKISFAFAVMASVNLLACWCIEDYSQMEKLDTLVGCLNKTMTDVKCKWPSVILIKAASYGRSSSSVCAHGKNTHLPCDLIDKKSIVKEICDYKNTCDIFISKKLFGDHCPTVDNYLNVIFSCERNPEKPTLSPTTESPLTNRSTNHTHPTTNNTQATKPTTSTPPTSKPLTKMVITSKKVTTENKPITFNPNGPDLDFLANSAGYQIPCPYRVTLLLITMFIALLHYI